MFIILTAAEADKVRGVTTKGNALQPFLLKDGTFMLPAEVLGDPAHAAVAGILEGLPQRPVDMGTPVSSVTVSGGEVERDPLLTERYVYSARLVKDAI